MDRMKKESVVISVTLRQGMVNQLDKIASRFAVKPNRLIGNFIAYGFDEFKALKKYGILPKIFYIQNFLKQHGIDVKQEAEDKVKHERAMSISVRISKELNEELDKWALEFERTKSNLIESCIGLTIDHFKALDVGPMVEIGVSFAKLVDAIKEGIMDKKKLIKTWKERSKRAREISNEMFDIGVK